MDQLPDVILLDIFRCLDHESLCLGVRMVCRRWRRVTFDKSLWRSVTIPKYFSEKRRNLLLRHIHNALEDLDVSDYDQNAPEKLSTLTKFPLPRLKKLTFDYCNKELGENLSTICPNLQEIQSLQDEFLCNEEDDPDYMYLQKQFHQLTAIYDKPTKYVCTSYVRDRRWEDFQEIMFMMLSCNTLKKYHFYDNNGHCLTPERVKIISGLLPQLRTLYIEYGGDTDEGLCQLFQNLKHLRNLTLRKTSIITDVVLLLIADRCPDLESIAVDSCEKCQITNEGVQYLVKKCSKIRVLHLQYNGQEKIIDDTLRKISEHLKHLTDFRLTDNGTFTEHGVDHLSSSCQWLRVLYFCECDGMNDAALSKLLDCRCLQTISIVYCESITPNGLTNFMAVSTTVKDMTFCSKDENFYPYFNQLTSQTRANIAEAVKGDGPINRLALQGIDGYLLKLLVSICPNLSTLDLNRTVNIDEEKMIPILQSCELEYLDISFMEEEAVQLMRVVSQRAQRLRVFKLGNLVTTAMMEALSEVIKCAPSLTALEFRTAWRHDVLALVKAAKKYHGGRCILYSYRIDRFKKPVVMHFTPLIYLNSIRKKRGRLSSLVCGLH